MSEKWLADGTRVFMGDGGFDLRNCPDPMNRADKIVRAVNSLASHEARIAELEEALRQIANNPFLEQGWVKDLARAALHKEGK